MEKQLDLFDDAPNVVDDDNYELNVAFTFTRETDDTTENCSVTMGEAADYLPNILAAFHDFLNRLGFGYVDEIQAVVNQRVHSSSLDDPE